jgi:hypothetical protein
LEFHDAHSCRGNLPLAWSITRYSLKSLALHFKFLLFEFFPNSDPLSPTAQTVPLIPTQTIYWWLPHILSFQAYEYLQAEPDQSFHLIIGSTVMPNIKGLLLKSHLPDYWCRIQHFRYQYQRLK